MSPQRKGSKRGSGWKPPRDRREIAHGRAGGAGRHRGHRRPRVVPAPEPRLRIDVDGRRHDAHHGGRRDHDHAPHRHDRPHRQHGRTHHRAGPDVDALSGAGVVRASFEAGRGFPLDRFQTLALDALDAGRSVLVAAPTGSGKTLVAEYAIAKARADGGKVFYTTPLKALSNQKYGDLVREHGSDRGRAPHRRQHGQRRRADRGDDHRGAAQHDLRGVAHARRPALRRARRGALPPGPLPRPGVGGGHRPPPGRGHAGVPLGHGVERRGGGGVDRDGARQHRGDHRGAPTGDARAPVPGGGAGQRRPPPPAHVRRRARRRAATQSRRRPPRRQQRARPALAGPTAIAHAHARAGWRPPSCSPPRGCCRRSASSSAARGATRRSSSASPRGCA